MCQRWQQATRTETIMRIYITTLLLVVTRGVFGQSIDSLGIDDNPILNKYEANYFNIECKDQKNDFDFLDKKVAFVTGSSANKLLTKSTYFDNVKARLKGNHGITHFAIFLTDEERINSGDYDVIIASWVKLLTDKRRRQIISELKKLNKDS